MGFELKDVENGIKCVEMATRHGMRIVPVGKGQYPHVEKRLPEIPGYDKKEAQTTAMLLKHNRDVLKTIASDPEDTREALCKGQQAVSEAFAYALVLLDLFASLEKAYRIWWPDVTACIHDGKGCPAEAQANCTACSEVKHAR